MALLVSVPQLSAEGVTGLVFAESKPIHIVCGSVTFAAPHPAAGSPIDPLQASLFGYRLYRKQSSGAGGVWDAAAKQWMGAGAQPQPQTLFLQDGVWQGLLVAMGQTDAAGAPLLATSPLTHYPRYYVRCLFAAADAAGVVQSGESGPSADFEVVTLADSKRAGLALQPEDAAAAEHILLFLKDSGLVERGRIEIRRDGSGFRIDLAVAGASVTLDSSGDIHLAPAAGRSVYLDGPTTIGGNLTVNGIATATGGFTP